MVGSFLFFLLIGVLLTTGIDGATVTVETDSPGISNQPVQLRCLIEWDDDSTLLDRLFWEFTPNGGAAVDMYKYPPGEAQGSYVGRLEAESPDEHTTEHELNFTNTSWCEDVGTYACVVYAGGADSPEVSGHADLSASDPSTAISVSGHEEDEGGDIVLPGPEEVEIQCTSTWNDDSKITLAFQDGGVDPVEDDGKLTGDDNCTRKADTSLDFEFTRYDEEHIVICTVGSHEVRKTVRTAIETTTAGGTGVGQTTGMLLASILAVTVIQGIV